MDDCAGLLTARPDNVLAIHELVIPDAYDPLNAGGTQTVSGDFGDIVIVLGHVERRRDPQALGIGIAYRLRYRMRRVLFYVCGKPQQAFGSDALDRRDHLDMELTLRERARLVEDDGFDTRKLLEVVTALGKHAAARQGADAAVEAQRNRDDERTWA